MPVEVAALSSTPPLPLGVPGSGMRTRPDIAGWRAVSFWTAWRDVRSQRARFGQPLANQRGGVRTRESLSLRDRESLADYRDASNYLLMDMPRKSRREGRAGMTDVACGPSSSMTLVAGTHEQT